ncbi:MAG: polysaccharide biosynthesis C-terminal domain-containing protein [Ignavibacteria bacterium]|nr:polysaccharide biosynthesis C-terminal domain-containing protein [Ignavibacteria bacterium]
MAILVGPIGIGVMSQLGGISAIVFSVIPLGTVGITKYLSQYFEDDRKEDIRALIKYVVVWNFPILLTAMILIVVFSENISKFLFNDAHNSYLVVIFGLSLFFGLLSSIVEIVLKSVRKVSLYVKYTIISALLTLLISIPAIYFLNLTGAVLTFGFTFCFSFLVGFLLLKKNNLIPIGAKMKKTEKKVKSDILKIGLASTIMLVIQQVTLIYIKSTIAAKFGLSEVGIYQSVFSISTNYFGLFFGIIGIYCIPKLSTLKENSETILELSLIHI